MSQAKQYNTFCILTGRDNLDSAYHAAFYLLSYDNELYESACKCVSHDGIDFAKIKRTTRGFDESTRFVIDIAHNLFSYTSSCKATPFEISRLGNPLMEQVCNALYIAAGQLKVIIRTDEQQNEVMEFDAEPYQRTKHVHSRLKHMQECMMTQHNESNELER